MKKTNISVAMATYNGEKYIQEQLNSLAKQTVLPYELVVCDDGSRDKTIKIIKKFSTFAPFPVRIYINETNLGYADNFLKSATLCRGEWITFCDQDDVWLPNKILRLRKIIALNIDNELVMVGHTSLMAAANLELTGQKLPDFKKDEYIKHGSNFGFFCIVGFSMAFKASLLKEADPNLRPRIYQQNPKIPPGHDQWIGMLANAVGDIAYISEPLAIWRRHDLSLTTPPRANQNIADIAKKSIAALRPEPYILTATMASESASSLQNIAEISVNIKTKNRLLSASSKFHILSKKLMQRAEIYSSQNRFTKIKALFKMLRMNAYGGAKFNALDWKSFAKDAAFAFGIIG